MQKVSPMKRRSKLLYVPGIISLACLLPLLLMAMVSRQKARLYTMEVTWTPDDSFMNDPNGKLVRDFIPLTLSGNPAADKIKLDFAELTIHEISASYDTVRGLKIIFNDRAHYESFIDILNMCERKLNVNCIASADHIWIFNRIKDEEQLKLMFFCGTEFARPPVKELPVSVDPKKYLSVFSLFVLLGIVSIFKTTRLPFISK